MTDKQKFRKLLEPGRIGTLQLKNHIVMPPMGTGYADENGYVTERLKDYYEERAKGGVGLLIVELTCVDTLVGKGFTHQLAIDDDKHIPGLRELARVIKRHGAKAAIQIQHMGLEANPQLSKYQAVGPSAIRMRSDQNPRELSIDEIADTVNLFVRTAERAREAGFDAVEVHGAGGYLINQFLSSAWNRRQDDYGGEIRNRARFLLDIIRGIRQTLGSHFPVWPRINAIEESLDGGITLEEGQQVARMAQEAGADAVSVMASSTIGGYFSNPLTVPYEPGLLVPFAEAIKKVVTVPVIIAGRIGPELGEEALQAGKADYIAIGRGLYVDPELPHKVASGTTDDIMPCVSCMFCIERVIFDDKPLMCTMNPAIGREAEYRLTNAAKQKRVLVVGAGPAGMEAAIVAAARGHDVFLYEEAARLGGQLNLMALPPTSKQDKIEPLTRYFINRVNKLGITVKLNTAVTPEAVEKLRPDVVIVATGSKVVTPQIPGVKRGNVVTDEDVLTGKVEVGQEVIIICLRRQKEWCNPGCQLVAEDIAEVLAAKGSKVTMMKEGMKIGAKLMPVARRAFLDRLAQKGVTMLNGVHCEEITAEGVVISTEDGGRRTVEADTIVIAASVEPKNQLAEELKTRVPEVYVIGDCVSPRSIGDAIADGFQAGYAV